MSGHGSAPILAVAVLAASLAACGSGTPPTAPTPPPTAVLDYTRTPLEFSPDPHVLELQGGDITLDGRSRPCTPLGVPSIGKSVNTVLWFAREDDEWVGRSRPPHRSTLTMRVRRVSSSILGVIVEGTVDGYAADEFDPMLGALDLVFEVLQDGTLAGTLSPAAGGGAVRGRLSGALRGHFSFAGGSQEVATCTSVHFDLRPVPPAPASARLEPGPKPDGAGAPEPGGRRLGLQLDPG